MVSRYSHTKPKSVWIYKTKIYMDLSCCHAFYSIPNYRFIGVKEMQSYDLELIHSIKKTLPRHKVRDKGDE